MSYVVKDIISTTTPDLAPELLTIGTQSEHTKSNAGTRLLNKNKSYAATVNIYKKHTRLYRLD